MDIKGYTLLEVSLFLAISGGLTLVAIVALAPRLTNVRFTSAMRGLQENVTKEMSISELGYNSGAGNKYECSASGGNLVIGPGNSNSSSCVFVGRLAVFNSGRVDYRSIAALRTTASCSRPEYSYEALTECNLANVFPANTSYDYSNGIKTFSAVPAVYGYGYVKSPDNNSTYRFILQNPSTSQFQLKNVTPLPAGANPKVCYQLSNRRAHLELSATRAEPTLVFNGVCS